MLAFATATWNEVADRWGRHPARALALIPVGSTEAHGPHLPLATDVIIATAVADRAAGLLEAKGWAAATLPPLAYGVTEFAGDFAGTVGVCAETVVSLLADVCQSLARQGARGIALVNHHLEPAHFEAVHAAAAEANRRSPQCVVVVPDHRSKRWGPPLGDEFCRGGSHAGTYETSLVLAAEGALVRREREGLPPRPVDLGKAIRDGARRFGDIPGAERAYLGDPSAATPVEGKRLLDLLAEMTATTLLEALPKSL
jgi:creatinine amidohydrolase